MDLYGPDFSDSRDPIFSDFRDPMLIFCDSRDPMIIFYDSGDLNRVPKTPLKKLFLLKIVFWDTDYQGCRKCGNREGASWEIIHARGKLVSCKSSKIK